MTRWNQSNLRLRMKVLAVDGEQIGHIAKIYEDSFLIHKGYLFPVNRYIPYSAISSLKENEVRLSLSSSQIEDALWKKRPDYEHHPGDILQLFYDRGHGIKDTSDHTEIEQP